MQGLVRHGLHLGRDGHGRVPQGVLRVVISLGLPGARQQDDRLVGIDRGNGVANDGVQIHYLRTS